MVMVKVGRSESLDSALRRFKRLCQKAGVLAEVRRRSYYGKPGVRQRKKAKLTGKGRGR